MEIDHTITVCEQCRRDQLPLRETLTEQNRDLRETRIKSLHEMEDLKRVQELRVDEFSRRRRLIENQDTIKELTARSLEPQNEISCLTREILKMLNQYAVDNPRYQSTSVARRMGSPRHAKNRRRRTREGPEPACVQNTFLPGHMQGEGKDELTSCRGTVQSAWQYLP